MGAASDLEAPREKHRHGTSRQRGPWLAGVALLAVLASLIVVFAALRSRGTPPNTGGATPAASSTAPASWQMYRDPAGLFTVRIPAGWTATTDTSTATVGDRTGSGQEPIYDTALGDPPRGSATITVYIHVSALNTPFLHHWQCGANAPGPPANTTVDGVPARYDPIFGWLFDTDVAHYQVSYIFPGWTGSILQTSAPTPIPPATLQAGQQLMSEILATFTPSSTKPLTC
jgi:hypothetical protein